MIIRHGDQLLRSIEKLPRGIKELKDKTLAYGTETGHSHRFDNPTLIKRFELKDKLYLQVLKRAVLNHEEHGPLSVPKGFYEQITEREYDYAEQQMRTVID